MSLNAQSNSRKPGSGTGPHAQTFDCIFPGITQVIALGASSVPATNPFQASTSVIQVCSTQPAFIKIAASAPVVAADGTCLFLPANVPVKLGVTPGWAIAAIQGGTGGNLYVTEGS